MEAMKTMTEAIAKELKELREEACISKTEAAAHVGKTYQTITNWESGTSEPTISAYNYLTGFYRARIKDMSR